MSKIFTGIGVSQGVALGTAVTMNRGQPLIDQGSLVESDISQEIERFHGAQKQLKDDLDRARKRLQKQVTPGIDELISLMDVQIGFLRNSRLLRIAEQAIQEKLMSAPMAIQSALADIKVIYDNMTDPYLASRFQDIEAVAHRLLNILVIDEEPLWHLPKGSVLVAHDISPADMACFEPGHVVGLVAETGGLQGHVAILARALGIPAVMGVTGLLDDMRNGVEIIVDGRGRVIVEPDDAEKAAARQSQRDFFQRLERLRIQAREPAISDDGQHYTLQANVELPHEVSEVQEWGAQGIGLLRTEFLFLNRRSMPTEEEQTEVLTQIVQRMAGKPITIRTLDVGGEKILPGYGEVDGDAENPALGLRAVRLSLRHVEPFRAQLRAILRAAKHGPVHILFPMVMSVHEIQKIKSIVQEEYAQLDDVQRPVGIPQLGIMIEVPAAALCADLLARHVDFLSLGTNDLTQYTLAIDRTNDKVASMYDPLHPAVLRLIQFSVEAARRADIPITLCGEMAGDPVLTPLLMGLGLRHLSMAPRALPEVMERVRSGNATELQAVVTKLMQDGGPDAIRAFVDMGT